MSTETCDLHMNKNKHNQPLQNQINQLDESITNTIAHQKREAVFSEEANTRFAHNIACINKYYPDLGKAIEEFELRDDFCLHVTKSGHGNFVPRGMSLPLYGDDPIAQSQNQVNEHVNNAYFTVTDYGSYPKKKSDDRIHTSYMVDLGAIMRENEDAKQPKLKYLPDTFPTAMIFGLGLGYHVPMLMERCQFDYTFLIEPDFEVFFASLFCTDWASIIERIDEQGGNLYFHLGVSESTLIADLEVITESIGSQALVRSFCYQHIPNSSLNDIVKIWFEDYFKFQTGHGFYNDAITGLAHSIHHAESQVGFLHESDSKAFEFQDIPVFIIGNGPSLDEASDFIKQQQSSAIIVAAGSALASLVKLGINSDFHVLVERPLSNYKIVEDVLPKEEYLKTNLLSVNVVYPDTTKLYKWSGLALKGNESGTDLLRVWAYQNKHTTLPLPSFSNPLVSNTACSLFSHMGFKHIYLFGVDNGNCVSGKHHSKFSFYRNSPNEPGYHSPRVTESTLEGNLGGFVYTNDLYKLSHRQIESLISTYPDVTFYNVGNGAKLKGAVAVNAEELLPVKSDIEIDTVVESIKKDFYKPLSLSIDDEFVGVGIFNDVCEHLMDICRENVSSRAEAASNLKRQEQYVYSLRGTVASHLFHILKGSLLYFHCPIITLLYSYEDDEFTLQRYEQLNMLWINYINSIQADFGSNYREFCDYLNPSQV
ncbi:motility associated factor glycosyltransferase family protein [Pseudoalteromonas sp. MMG013]|uniref:motility associated factor glycosyltransferase family protein n=1 Tax=Pseudoalteromonas sp. MMG013 TaxID=2822687 RepID=UPI001B38223B|nr:6-hydroxymethylpterin diphosphokinase MptE-like protein [Pseudoalteromonas sp. MMG013]MBQ4862004.1 motility associated factor glycosyltransferase family protein [Pseudoalteromonas sp. MMG013]